MARTRTRERSKLVAVAAVAAVLMTSTLASAHGGDTNKVHACVLLDGGQIRIVDATESCRRNEASLDWAKGGANISWDDLPGVPDGFADDVDNDTTYSAGSGLALSPGNQFSVTGAPWSGLTGVPAVFADGVDADGSGLVSALRSELGSSASGSLVSFSQIFGIDITGSHVQDGALTASDLAGTYDGGLETVIGAVTSEKIADGTIGTRDISDGAVQTPDVGFGAITTEKMTANWATTQGLPVTVEPVPDAELFPGTPAILNVVDPTGTAHVVSLSAQALVSCICIGDDSLAVSWQLFDGNSEAIGPQYTATLNQFVTSVVTPMTALHRAASSSGGTQHQYQLHITTSGTGSRNISGAYVTAIDLGRS